MDPRIKNLKSTTFFGRRFTRRQIADIQQTVATFPALSRKELAQTICEHLHWRTPTGGNRVAAALGLLKRLERAGILTLPAKRARNRRPRKPVALTPRTAPQPRIEDRLRDLLPLRLQLAAPEQTGLWNEFVQRHHYLGYKQPLGPHLRYARRPVLLETFVDPQRFRGTCYRAANWLRVGRTKGRADAGRHPKDVYLYPLAKHCREILLHGPRPRPRKQPAPAPPTAPDADFVALWQGLIGSLGGIAAAHDRRWQKRSRVLNTLLVMLFVFRLVFAPRRQGYVTTLAQLWAQCRTLEVPLPQPQPVSDAAMCKARPKVDETVFQQFHAEILRCADQPGPAWLGHRVFAVDGSKLNLPRPLRDAGYTTPSEQAHYPQGLLSCLYRLQSRLPVDFDLVAHANERLAALAHLPALEPRDVVVYDRGYYSFELLCAHRERGLHAVFRIRRKAGKALDRFIDSKKTDKVCAILPGRDALRELSRKHPGKRWRPLPLRLVKYTRGATEYVLGTTLLDSRRYRVAALADLYHARWGVEELYKVSKQFLAVDQFHGRSERLVKQELFAHFNLIAMTRLLANRDAALCEAALPQDGGAVPQANFKHSLAALAQHLEGLLLRHSAYVSETLERICEWVGTGRRKRRPNRSYPRRSLRPASKWDRR